LRIHSTWGERTWSCGYATVFHNVPEKIIAITIKCLVYGYYLLDIGVTLWSCCKYNLMPWNMQWFRTFWIDAHVWAITQDKNQLFSEDILVKKTRLIMLD